jgi:hypothetical protein
MTASAFPDPSQVVASHKCFLEAMGDEHHLMVFRSPVVRDTDPIMVPVNAHIAEHDLVLAEQETVDLPGMMFGEALVSRYMSRVALRDGLLSHGGPHPIRTMFAEESAFWDIVQ